MQLFTVVEISAAQAAIKAFGGDRAKLGELLDTLGGQASTSQEAPSLGTAIQEGLRRGRGAGKRGNRSGARKPAKEANGAAPPAPKAKEDGKRHRSSAEEVQAQKDKVLAIAAKLPAGFAKGNVAERIGGEFDPGRALGLLVDEGKLIRTGERRNTTYTVA